MESDGIVVGDVVFFRITGFQPVKKNGICTGWKPVIRVQTNARRGAT